MEREGREGKRESESEREDRWNGNKIIPIIIREKKKRCKARDNQNPEQDLDLFVNFPVLLFILIVFFSFFLFNFSK